ncbi:MAG TPA: SDR family NAD(P)-dependent oxidoreductase [Solirubrobacteraceae bacterium]|nr:SDR family NAD(P)-dependent oxidoreductase [Solirubrobacteraceae bacterium]
MSRSSLPVAGRRVLISGAARGIGARLAVRLHERGARVALLGLEPDELRATAQRCGGAPWRECDVADRAAVQAGVSEAVGALGGLDVAVANAGIGAQMTLLDGNAEVWDRTLAVNLGGTFNLVRAAGPHVAHPGGYMLLTASLAAAVHLPLMSAYCASKAAVESLGDSLRIELAPARARVGVAYYAELDTDMTARGFATAAAARTPLAGRGRLPVSPVGPAIDALERGIARRSRRIVSPWWVAAVLPTRMLAQRVVETQIHGLGETLDIARGEAAPFTTAQPADEA